jgi:hypothetical protein
MSSERRFKRITIRHNLSLTHAENMSIARANVTLEEFFKKKSKVITD